MIADCSRLYLVVSSDKQYNDFSTQLKIQTIQPQKRNSVGFDRRFSSSAGSGRIFDYRRSQLADRTSIGFYHRFNRGRSGVSSGATGAIAVAALVARHGVEYLFAAVILK